MSLKYYSLSIIYSKVYLVQGDWVQTLLNDKDKWNHKPQLAPIHKRPLWKQDKGNPGRLDFQSMEK